MAPRRRKAAEETPAETVVVEAVEYTEDDNWDGEVVTEETAVAEQTEKKGRPGSPLVAASRRYDKARAAADKARKASSRGDKAKAAYERAKAAYDKYVALGENLAAAEKEEADALADLQGLLSGDNGSSEE